MMLFTSTFGGRIDWTLDWEWKWKYGDKKDDVVNVVKTQQDILLDSCCIFGDADLEIFWLLQ